MSRPKPLAALLVVVLGGALAACGTEQIDLAAGEDPRIRAGAEIFDEACSGCHTLESAGAQGSAVAVRDRERIDGPNFNTRKEDVESILYAIRNGGFSGALMPENIITGDDARLVAEYLAKYSGTQAEVPLTPNSGTSP